MKPAFFNSDKMKMASSIFPAWLKPEIKV
uniref:Uncharacterized protein n=1 Tax=Rhizophora mucronata TaxID=61149 RepID=A0A2P2JSF1_RHIMU